MNKSAVILTHEAGETHEIGRRIGGMLTPGDVLALVGDLAAGKTVLTQGIAEGLGVPPHVPVASPTFTLINRHQGRYTLIHADLYRISDPRELDSLGYEEWLDPTDAVSVIEWADRAKDLLPATHLRITLSHAGHDDRRIQIEPVNPDSAHLPAIVAAITS
jgi:tRNA threonylcarbamoyladenosine biosynthesis protein TsaE